MLNIGFRAPDEEPSPLSFDGFDLAEGWCALLKRSEVARGIAKYGGLNRGSQSKDD